MAYRYGDRQQMGLFPASLDDYVPEDAPVRAYDAFVEALDFKELGMGLDEDKVGNPEYDPKAMLKLLIYGYSYGVRSSRKLEREAHYNVSFMWIVGGLRPDHKTIAEFRRNNKQALKKVMKQCVRLCLKLNLIEGNTLFLDGTKIRANASIKNTWTGEKCERALEHIDRRIEAILNECERIDEEEREQPSLVRMGEELRKQEVLKAKVKEVLAELAETKAKAVNTTDPECTRINSLQGSHAGYNGQLVVDDKNGLVVSSDVVSENNDLYQFGAQVEKAQEEMGKKCETACADSGYATTDELEKVDRQGIQVVVPSQRQAGERERNPFDKTHFCYDQARDCYICPEGKELTLLTRKKKGAAYRIADRRTCLKCRKYGVCTKSRMGRMIARMAKEEVRERLERQYKESACQAVYKRRQEKAELPFGHIKRNLGVQAFLLRGLEGTRAEMALLTSCFNIRRMMSLIGVVGLMKALGG
jgi:transposase